jgi:Ribbon-helix-helix domain
MKESARWTLTVSSDVDRRARRYLASVNRKGDLSVFVEEAVRSKLLQLSMGKVPSRASANDVAPQAPPSITEIAVVLKA